MSYRDKIAPGRKSNQTDVTKFNPDNSKASSQEQFGGDEVRTVVANTSRYDNGHLVRVGPNTENTGKLKDPLQKYQRKVLSTDHNPDRGVDRSGNRVAAGRTSSERI